MFPHIADTNRFPLKRSTNRLMLADNPNTCKFIASVYSVIIAFCVPILLALLNIFLRKLFRSFFFLPIFTCELRTNKFSTIYCVHCKMAPEQPTEHLDRLANETCDIGIKKNITNKTPSVSMELNGLSLSLEMCSVLKM